MPEGDTVAGHARLLASALTGKELVRVEGTAHAVRRRSEALLGATVEDVRSVGKHLVIELSSGDAIRIHLGMTGRWQVGPIGKSVHGSARLVLGTDSHLAACYSAPTVEIERSEAVARRLRRLGPDLLAEFDAARFLERARAIGGRTVGEVLLDQRVLAGIGNVYKSEVLFLERVNPDTSVDDIDDDVLLALVGRAQALLAANVGRPRTTTGWPGQSRETWVYGRSGKPCRRCGTAIAQEEHAGRLTFWCPSCQPAPGGAAPRR